MFHPCARRRLFRSDCSPRRFSAGRMQASDQFQAGALEFFPRGESRNPIRLGPFLQGMTQGCAALLAPTPPPAAGQRVFFGLGPTVKTSSGGNSLNSRTAAGLPLKGVELNASTCVNGTPSKSRIDPADICSSSRSQSRSFQSSSPG
jgi:hypothetical protein